MNGDVGVMVLHLRQLTHAVHERERLAEVLERERSLERTVDLAPAIRIDHGRSIYDRAQAMTVTTENTLSGTLERSGRDRPARELAVATFFGPFAGLLVRALVPLRVPPPAVVLANMAAGLVGAVALARGELVLAALLLQLKTLLDNADGELARASGRVSLLGRYLDTEADLVVNAALFAALGFVTGAPWLALAAFLAVTFVLSVDLNVAQLYRGLPAEFLKPSGSSIEKALEGAYGIVFAPQDRLVRAVSARRLEGILAGKDGERGRVATDAYHDRLTVAVLTNLGLSTQLAALGVCLAIGFPSVYLWLALGCAALPPFLQLRRERLARRALAR